VITPRLLIATNNAHKTAELQRLLVGLSHELLTPADLGLRLDVLENGRTFTENAALKAHAFAEASGLLALADDSGIEVDALDGGPGIYSARYGGAGLSDDERVQLLLRELAATPSNARGCRYVAALALAWPDGRQEVFEGACVGIVATIPVGDNGFGYDPVFFVPEKGLTIAQLSGEAKDTFSHRGNAARLVIEALSPVTAHFRGEA
jgi:XTP/dITP diphosphohydrolase